MPQKALSFKSSFVTKEKVETAEQTLNRISKIGSEKIMALRRNFKMNGDASFRTNELGTTVELYGRGCGRSEFFKGSSLEEAALQAYAWSDARGIRLHWIDRIAGHSLSI